MKFSDLGTIHQKYFSQLKLGKKSKSDWWARERLGLLKRHGFLASKRISFSGVSYFLATDLAHTALSSMRPSRTYVRPLVEIDVRSFEHDRRVIEARLCLEKAGRATNWQSERRLKSESTLTAGLPRHYQPDAIYWNKLGDAVAFELELSAKARDRYEDKIRKYLELIRQGEAHNGTLKGVLFVAVNDYVFQMLSELTRRHQEKFKLQKFNEIVGITASEKEGTDGK